MWPEKKIGAERRAFLRKTSKCLFHLSAAKFLLVTRPLAVKPRNAFKALVLQT